MANTMDAGINVVIDANGVRTIQFCGDGFDAEAAASRIYQLVRPLIVQIDRLLKEDSFREPGAVQ